MTTIPYIPAAVTHVPILVVDDDATVRGLLNKVLTAAGYEVLLAADADEFIVKPVRQEELRARLGSAKLGLDQVAWDLHG